MCVNLPQNSRKDLNNLKPQTTSERDSTVTPHNPEEDSAKAYNNKQPFYV